LPDDKQAAFEQQAKESLQAQIDIEAQDQESFEDYVHRYERNLIPPELENS
jgi:glutamate--cysteine ligase